jgi:type VI secretion system protein ImpK
MPSQHLMLSSDNCYYRSKMFNTKIGVNPLIAAASPLFSLAGYLIEKNKSPALNLAHLSNNLQYEIKVYENNAKLEQYHSDTIIAGRYLICAFLDEIIQEEFSEWQNFGLLKLFHGEEDKGERFFFMMEKLSQDPEYHIDLLELIFLCLNLGYQGKYKEEDHGTEKLTLISERLFESIRTHRGDLKKELHITPLEKPRPPLAKIYFPLWLIAGFSLALLLTIYSSFSYMLGNSATALYQEISSIL